MAKSEQAKASKKASEKRRLQRRKEEFRQGVAPHQGGLNAVIKQINRSLAAARVDDALRAFRSCVGDPYPHCDTEACCALLLALAKSCRHHDAVEVAAYMRDRALRVPLPAWTLMLQSASQLWAVADALLFVDTVEPLVTFPEPAAAAYYCKFSRLILQVRYSRCYLLVSSAVVCTARVCSQVRLWFMLNCLPQRLLQEFLSEAADSLQRIRTQSGTSLAYQHLALLNLRAQPQPSGGVLALVSPTGADLYQVREPILCSRTSNVSACTAATRAVHFKWRSHAPASSRRPTRPSCSRATRSC
jgi:hypothetical protein